MADLTNNDFIVFSEIPYLNAGRASHVPPLPNLKKNPALSKGEIRSPQSGEDLYAHNFLNVIDWYVAFLAIRKTGSEPTIANIESACPSFTEMSYDVFNSFFSTHEITFEGPESIDGIFYNHVLIKKSLMPSTYQEENSSQETINSIRTYLYHLRDIGAIYQGTTAISDQINASKELLANDFPTPFYSFSQYVENLKDGCSVGYDQNPSVESWDESFSSDKDPATGKDFFSPVTPEGNGPFKIIRKTRTWGGSSYVDLYSSQTDIPVYNEQDILIANSAYIHKENGTTFILKKASEMIDVEVFVMLYQRVYTTNGQILRQKYMISKATSSIGSLYSPGNSQALYFRLSPNGLRDMVDSMQPQLDPSNYATGDSYNISMYSTVKIIFFLSIKNIP